MAEEPRIEEEPRTGDESPNEEPGAIARPERRLDRRAWLWTIPVATLIVGMLLGVMVAGASGTGEGTTTGAAPAAAPTGTPGSGAQPAPAPSVSGRSVFVPASCEEGLTRARTALSTVRQAVDALQKLDTARLQQLLDQLQTAQQDVDRLAEQCQRTAAAQNGT